MGIFDNPQCEACEEPATVCMCDFYTLPPPDSPRSCARFFCDRHALGPIFARHARTVRRLNEEVRARLDDATRVAREIFQQTPAWLDATIKRGPPGLTVLAVSASRFSKLAKQHGIAATADRFHVGGVTVESADFINDETFAWSRD